LFIYNIFLLNSCCWWKKRKYKFVSSCK